MTATSREYKALQVQTIPVRHINEHPIGDRLAQLGAPGWERSVVAMTADPAGSVLLFKRAVAGAPGGAGPRYPPSPKS